MSETEDTDTSDVKMDTIPEESEVSQGFSWHKLAFLILIPWAIIKWFGKIFFMMGSWVYSPSSKNY